MFFKISNVLYSRSLLHIRTENRIMSLKFEIFHHRVVSYYWFRDLFLWDSQWLKTPCQRTSFAGTVIMLIWSEAEIYKASFRIGKGGSRGGGGGGGGGGAPGARAPPPSVHLIIYSCYVIVPCNC